jgi:hypothetical protein
MLAEAVEQLAEVLPARKKWQASPEDVRAPNLRTCPCLNFGRFPPPVRLALRQSWFRFIHQ